MTIVHAKVTDELRKACTRGEYAAAVPQLRPIAEAGDAEAQYMLASALDVGERSVECVQWYERASELGDAKAQAALGSIYAYGTYDTREPARGVALLERALANGYEPAHTLADEIAAFYRDGVGVGQDWKRAYELFQRATKDGVWGFAYSYLDVAWSEFWGFGTERKEGRAADTYAQFLQLRTCHDQTGASLALAALHILGLGVDRDRAEVVAHLQNAARLRPFAGFLLAHCHLTGYGVPRDPRHGGELLDSANAKLKRPIDPGHIELRVVAARLWSAMEAAWLGDAKSQFAMANFSMTHEKNPSAYVHTRELNRWLRIAAHNGNANAQLRLGECFLYWKGSQVPPDEQIGLSWVRRAADQGLPEAIEELARRLERMPPEEALKWKQRAPSNDAEVSDATRRPKTMAEKLDLALAFLDLGDPEGGRDLLEEVAAGGDALQRERSEACLSQIGPRPTALATLRNQLARALGFPDYPSDLGGLVLEVGQSAVFARAVEGDAGARVTFKVVAIDKIERMTPEAVDFIALAHGVGQFVLRLDEAQIHYNHEMAATAFDPEKVKTMAMTMARECDDVFDVLARLTGGQRFVLPDETAA